MPLVQVCGFLNLVPRVLSLASRKEQEREAWERGYGFALSLYHSLFLYDVFIYHLSLLIRGQQNLCRN